MTSLKVYFSYQFKKSLSRFAIMGAISLLFTVLFVDVHTYTIEAERYASMSIGILPMILGVICTIIPILELAPFKNRRNLDTLLFLPVSRLKMSIVHYLNGLIEVVGIYTACSAYTILHLLKYRAYLSLGYFFPYFLLSLLFGIVLYSLFTFIFYQGNTVADGVVFQFIYIFFLVLIASTVSKAFDLSNNGGQFTIYSPISILQNIFVDKIAPYAYSPSTLKSHQLASLIAYGVLGILSVFGFIFDFVKKKTEAVGGISNSYFGYKMLLPVCGYLLLFNLGESIITCAIFVTVIYVGYIIYRRSARLKMSDYICLIASIIPILLSQIFS